jgi:hypothetical protein
VIKSNWPEDVSQQQIKDFGSETTVEITGHIGLFKK